MASSRWLAGLALTSAVALPSTSLPVHASAMQGLFTSFASTRQTASGYSPEQVATAYNFSSLLSQGLDGTGQTIALLETDALDTQALDEFDNQFSLPAPTIQQYMPPGQNFRMTRSAETNLDVEWAHALAPGASIQIYYLQNNTTSKQGWAQVAWALNTAAANGARTISLSFGTCTASSGYKQTTSALSALAAQGVSVFVSSGDSGYHPGPVKDCGNKVGVTYPASDPSVVAVGGTSLRLNPNYTIASETAWKLSGGGLATKFPRASWQVAATLPAGTARGVPDVAFLGNPSTGVNVAFHGQWHVVGGTSVGAPAWAAAWSLILQKAQQDGKTLGSAAPLLYQVANSAGYHSVFHDITTGSNGKYSAGPGWDAVTGWGTPDVASLASAVEAAPTGTQ